MFLDPRADGEEARTKKGVENNRNFVDGNRIVTLPHTLVHEPGSRNKRAPALPSDVSLDLAELQSCCKGLDIKIFKFNCLKSTDSHTAAQSFNVAKI
jgi:hypothetical protein